jgi:hypothetical protein
MPPQIPLGGFLITGVKVFQNEKENPPPEKET